jgi:hypothetical protein
LKLRYVKLAENKFLDEDLRDLKFKYKEIAYLEFIDPDLRVLILRYNVVNKVVTKMDLLNKKNVKNP